MNSSWGGAGELVRVLGCKGNGIRHFRETSNPATGETLRLGAGVELELPDAFHLEGIPWPEGQGWFSYMAILLDVFRLGK